jgi:hypothetical protein
MQKVIERSMILRPRGPPLFEFAATGAARAQDPSPAAATSLEDLERLERENILSAIRET